mmetsp:Transcript_11272/g.37646  ORF Transcript_11272/g.37646 Transcript_11272/m.37646 type:complete len:254 (-) Transcript_11272:13-774(-)
MQAGLRQARPGRRRPGLLAKAKGRRFAARAGRTSARGARTGEAAAAARGHRALQTHGLARQTRRGSRSGQDAFDLGRVRQRGQVFRVQRQLPRCRRGKEGRRRLCGQGAFRCSFRLYAAASGAFDAHRNRVGRGVLQGGADVFRAQWKRHFSSNALRRGRQGLYQRRGRIRRAVGQRRHVCALPQERPGAKLGRGRLPCIFPRRGDFAVCVQRRRRLPLHRSVFGAGQDAFQDLRSCGPRRSRMKKRRTVMKK